MGGEEFVDYVVGEGSEEDFVDVEGEGVQVEEVGQGGCEGLEERGGGEGEWVVHFFFCCCCFFFW